MAKGPRNSGPNRDRTRTAGTSPEDPTLDIPPPPVGHPRSLVDTDAYKKGKNNASRLWNNYKTILKTSFNGMARSDQEALLTKASVIVTIGVTILALGLFYSLIPRQIRVFLVPGALFGAWWIGGKVVAQVIIARFEPILNKQDY